MPEAMLLVKRKSPERAASGEAERVLAHSRYFCLLTGEMIIDFCLCLFSGKMRCCGQSTRACVRSECPDCGASFSSITVMCFGGLVDSWHA